MQRRFLMWCALWGMASAVSGDVINVTAGAAEKAKFNKVVNVGDAAPDWTDLEGTDGKKHSLGDFQEKDILVVIFTCNHCPIAVAYEDRIVAVQKDYAAKGVQLVAINVNKTPDDSLPAMKERAEAKGFNFPYLYDPSQKSARSYGATVTPHVFVLDKSRKIAYMGAIDDKSSNPDEVKKPYLRDALDALLAGKEPPVRESRQKGCAIKYE